MSSLGDKITEIGTGEWKFNEAVADNFEEHILKSVHNTTKPITLLLKYLIIFLLTKTPQ